MWSSTVQNRISILPILSRIPNLQKKCNVHLFSFSLIFQCGSKNVANGDETLPILTHYIKWSEQQICQYFKDWTDTHFSFVEKVSMYICEQKGISTTDYLNIMCDSGTPLDEIVLLIVAHMFHIHIGF